MFRLSPRRSQRSKGFKVKHALQLSLLLGVSIWLLYQLKHSQDKKAALGEASVSINDVFKLGRKYLQPYKDETSIIDARHKEDEGDEESKNEVLKYKPYEMDDNNVAKFGKADDTVLREHDQDKDKDHVDQEKETQVSNEHTDPAKEMGERNTNDTEEKERGDKKENVDKVENGERKEDNKSLSEKIEVNESEKADHIEDVSTVNQNEKSKESVNGEGKEKEKENEQTKDQAEKEDEKNVKNQDGGEAKDGAEGSQEQEQNKQEEDAGDNSSKAVENQIQHVPDGNSTENVTNNTEVVDDARNQNVTNDEDGSKNEEKTADTSQTSFMTESHDPLQEKDNSVTANAGTSNPSVQNGTDIAYNTVAHNKTSEEDNSNLQIIEQNQTPESASAATGEQLDTALTSVATDADSATSGEFKDTTIRPQLHDKSTQTESSGDENYSAMSETRESSDGEKPNNNPSEEGTQESIVLQDTNGNAHAEKDEQIRPQLHENSTQNESSGDEIYSAMSETRESSDGEKPNNNPSEEGTQERIVLQDTNGNVHAEKDEQIASSDIALEFNRQGSSTSDNKGGAGQSETDKLVQSNATDTKSTENKHEAGEDGHVNTSDASSLQEDASARTRNTDENVVTRMEDENGNTGQNESSNYHQEIEESLQANSNADATQNDQTRSDFSMPQDVKEA